MNTKTKITVVGSGYVGMSLSVLFAQHNQVTVLDVDPSRVQKIINKESTVGDAEIESFLLTKTLDLTATLNKKRAYQDAQYIVVATPTNYNPVTNKFDTTSVDSVVGDALGQNRQALVVIKSTIPIGHTRSLQEKFGTNRVIFSPEFLREGQALSDNLYPSRIVVGGKNELAREFAGLLVQGADKKDIQVLFVDSTEAEAVKLFANTYLAMRVAFFNELDSYALFNQLDAKSIINGMSLDERIGGDYNNPSFGYGGYCLPKDTKQLLANYAEVPQNLIKAIVLSNATRKDFISNEILKKKPNIVGFYRLAMKDGSDNFRSSAIQGVIQRVSDAGVGIIIYEPELNQSSFSGFTVCDDLSIFKKNSDIVVTNRDSFELRDIQHKIFTRDIFNSN